MRKKYANCGREYNERKTSRFCSRQCYLESVRKSQAARDAAIWDGVTRQATNGEKRLPHVITSIVITAEIPVWPQFRPEVGRKIQAEKYVPGIGSRIGYVVEIGGKRICVREGECKEL